MSNESLEQIYHNKVVDMLKTNEGFAPFAYHCSQNKLTIGVGRCIEINGISEDESDYLLNNDIKKVQEQLAKNYGCYQTFPEKARLVCIDMCFQLGITGFMAFVKTRKLMELGKWLEASEECLRSKWAIQTPTRALRNSRELAKCQKAAKIIKATQD